MSIAGREITKDEEGVRLDRWFRRHFPALSHGRLERLLRTGLIRVDGRRVKSGYRLAPGDHVRIPPEAAQDQAPSETLTPKSTVAITARDRQTLRESVLHRDRSILVIDKPAGLAVQGGSAIVRHLDGMLEALKFDAKERPKLVHRLDKDTSGVLVLARNQRAAMNLAKAFRDSAVSKIYWAVVVGLPELNQGRIDLDLGKRAGPGGERVRVDASGGQRAITEYAVIDRAGREAAWLAFRPITGRTHQIRAHAAAIGTPILGDGKYGRRHAFLKGLGLSNRLHLHAYEVRLPHPEGGTFAVTAAPPAHFKNSLSALGFALSDYQYPFDD